MVWWKCNICGYTFQADTIPDDSNCPNCLESCTFKNVTCYLPDCGFDNGKEHIDHRL